jgi:hypothetical protein
MRRVRFLVAVMAGVVCPPVVWLLGPWCVAGISIGWLVYAGRRAGMSDAAIRRCVDRALDEVERC